MTGPLPGYLKSRIFRKSMDAVHFHSGSTSRFGLNEFFIGQRLRFPENGDFSLLNMREEVIESASRAILMAARPRDGVKIRKIPKNLPLPSEKVKKPPEALLEIANKRLSRQSVLYDQPQKSASLFPVSVFLQTRTIVLLPTPVSPTSNTERGRSLRSTACTAAT